MPKIINYSKKVIFSSLILFFFLGSLQILAAEYSSELLEKQLVSFKKINEGDQDAISTEKVLRLFEIKSYKPCISETLGLINGEKAEYSFLSFQFVYGVRCLIKLSKQKTFQPSDLEEWVEVYYSPILKNNQKDFHGSELDLFSKYYMRLGEIIYLNYEDLDLNLGQMLTLEKNIEGTRQRKVISKLFMGYLNRNNQVAAKELLELTDPKLQETKVLDLLYEHFQDDIYLSRKNQIISSKAISNELKVLYSRHKFESFIELLGRSHLITKKAVSQASRELGWLYVRGKSDFQKEVSSKLKTFKINYNEYFWVLSNQGLFKDIIEGYNQLSEQDKKRNLTMALKAYLYQGEYKKGYALVEKYKLLSSIGKSDDSLVFFATLMAIRFEKYLESLQGLNHLIANDSDFKLQSKYLKYNILKQLKKPEYTKEAASLVNLYPLTYYGLLVAHNEKLLDLLPFLKPTVPFEIEFKKDLPLEQRKLKHIGFILDNELSGSYRKFLSVTFSSLSFESQLVWAYWFKKNDKPLDAIKLMNHIWNSKSDWIHKDIIPIAYPNDLLPLVKKHATDNIDHNLVLGLIRQESAFQVKARSPSDARGLMQLLTSTAREVARSLRMRKESFPYALYKPDVNIKLGSHYLKRRVIAYQGQVPLALASYNVGPGRLSKWSSGRDLITDLQGDLKSESWKTQDLWVEEMPWDETRFYVKAVLRNYYLYTLFEDYKPLEKCYRLWNCQKD